MKNLFLLAAVAATLSAVAEDLAPFPTWSEPRAVTSGPHEHFLASYFAIDSWSPNKRYMLVLETDVNGRLPEAGERCTLGVVDLEDGNRFIPVTTTACWNFQEAAMAFWMDDETILFNDLRDGKFKTVIMNWKTGKDIRVLPRPVSAVSEDRTWAVSVNYARLSLLRPDYGYAGPGQDAQETVPWPENDGLWTMDLKTGESKLILSIAATRSQQPEPQKVEGKPGQPLAYHCHTVISKDGEKIFFLARSVDWFDKVTHKIPYWNTTSFTVNRDGTELRRCFKDGWAGSHFNWAPDGSHKMLVTATWYQHDDPKETGHAWSTVEFEVGKEDQVRRIGAGILDQDWHCIYSPDGKFMSGETYWNKYNERPWVLTRLADGMSMPMGSFYVPPQYRQTYWRCDLHARYRPDGRQIAFNSVHEGSRQVYVRDITPAVAACANPILPGWYADPQICQFGDTFWIFPTYSHDFDEQTFFDAFSSKDLKTWTRHEHVLDVKDVPWGHYAFWAPDAIEKDGKYYLFFSANEARPVENAITRDQHKLRDMPKLTPQPFGHRKYGGIGVAVADRPEGPYRDLIGKPLIDQFWNGAQPIDQYVFSYQGDWYMAYGGWGRCNLVKLANDFKSLVPFEDGSMWKAITPNDYVEGSVIFERKGIWYFMYSSGGWVNDSYRVNYATAKTPFGPYEFKGCVLSSQKPLATGAGHHSVLNVRGTDDWYICYHRRPIPNESMHHRVTCLDKLEFDDEGMIKPVVMTASYCVRPTVGE